MITQGEGGGVGGGSTTNFCSTNPADQVANIDNILSRLTAIETILSQLLGTDITAIQLSDISQDLGTILGANLENGLFGDNLSQGYVPYAVQIGADAMDWSLTPSFPNTVALAPGFSAIVPIPLSAKMKMGGIVARFLGSSIADSTWRIDIYKETFEGQFIRIANCPEKTISVPSYTTMPAKAQVYPTSLAPGMYYIMFRNLGDTTITLAAKDAAGESGSTSVFFNTVRTGIFLNDEADAEFVDFSQCDKLPRSVYIGMFGVIDAEEFPYGFDGAPIPYFEW